MDSLFSIHEYIDTFNYRNTDNSERGTRAGLRSYLEWALQKYWYVSYEGLSIELAVISSLLT